MNPAELLLLNFGCDAPFIVPPFVGHFGRYPRYI